VSSRTVAPRFAKYNSAMSRTDLTQLWAKHTNCEFVTRDTDATLSTMVEDAVVNHVPVMTGGVGKQALREFYSNQFFPNMPPDMKMTLISRTVDNNQIVDEMIFSFTHTQEMPWMLPGVAPTNRHVDVPLVAIVQFRNGKIASEHIYWDQASVLKQIGLLTDTNLPVFGAEAARKAVNPRYENRRGGRA
jgi:carboxymethylenebutenolidase